MDAKIINRVLSVMFLVLTIFFLVLYGKEVKIKSRLTEEFVAEAVCNLKNSGIAVSESVISSEIPSKNIYAFETENIEKRNKKIASILCAELYGSNVTTANFETPEGVSVGVYDGDENNEIARIIFDNNASDFRIVNSGVNISGTDLPFFNDRSDMLSENQVSVIDKISKALSFESKLGYRISGCSGDESFVVVTAVQTVDGYDCSDVYMNYVFENDKIVAVFGRWVVEPVKSKYNNTLPDGVNALYELDLDKVSEITGQKISYRLKNTDSTKFFVVPVWEISYVDVDGLNNTKYVESF